MTAAACPTCGVQLNWREAHAGVCRGHDPAATRTGTVPYPQFCLHPDRCDGLTSCPRDYACSE